MPLHSLCLYMYSSDFQVTFEERPMSIISITLVSECINVRTFAIFWCHTMYSTTLYAWSYVYHPQIGETQPHFQDLVFSVHNLVVQAVWHSGLRPWLYLVPWKIISVLTSKGLSVILYETLSSTISTVTTALQEDKGSYATLVRYSITWPRK